MRRKKLTATQRRLVAEKRKTLGVRYDLENLQQRMQNADSNAEGVRQLRQMIIMQEITQAIERLK